MEKFGAILAAFSLVAALFSGFAGAADVNSVTVCKGEQAAFEFQLHNKVDPLTYDISVSGLDGVLSVKRISLGRDEKVNFTFTVPTADKAFGNFPFTVTADGGASVSTASALLTVANCYDAFLSANPSAIAVYACAQGSTKLALQNRGSKADTFTLTSSGDLGLIFTPSQFPVSPSASASSDAKISVPCGSAAGMHPITITANGVSKSSAVVNVQVLIPTPTPIPQGCAYNNPACPSPQVCQDNRCVTPPGCKYHNPDCPSGYYCDEQANICKEVQKVPAPILTSSVQFDVCRGEKVKFDYEITNPSNGTQNYALSTDGMAGAFAPASVLATAAGQKRPFSLTVDTTSLEPKTYYFNVVATSADKSVRMQSGLRVSQCYASALSLPTTEVEFCPGQVKTRTLTVKNTGSQSDVYALSAKDYGEYKVEFSPSALLLQPGGEAAATILLSAPLAIDNKAGPITRTTIITATSNAIAAVPLRLTVKKASDCPLELYPSMYLSAVRACINETARLKFELYNPSDEDMVFSLFVKGIDGKLSASSIPVKAKASEPFYFDADSTGKALGRYPLEILAQSTKATVRASSMLIIDDCYASNLTLVSIVGGAQQVQVITAVPTAAPGAAATATATAATSVSPSAGGLLKVIPSSVSTESGLETAMGLVLRNDAPFEVTSVRLFISNVTITQFRLLPSIKPGELVPIEFSGYTELSAPANVTVRAVGEEAYGEGELQLLASPSRIASAVLRTSTQSAKNGTRENVTVTVRLSNNGKKDANLSLSSADSAVAVNPSNISLAAGASKEITLNTELAPSKEYEATLVVRSPDGTYRIPVVINTKTGGTLTGLFSGSLASAAALALVTIAIVTVLLYLARKQGEEEPAEEESAEAGEKEEAKPARRRRRG